MPEQGAAPPRRRTVLFEVTAAFLIATAVVAGLYRLRSVPIIERNLAVVAAVVFLYLPALILWRRGHDLDQYGLRLRPLKRGLLWFGGTAAILVPGFSLGYFVWLRSGCLHLPSWLVYCPVVGPTLAGTVVRWPPQPGLLLLSQLLVVALPEEFFFRGFLQGRLREVMSAKAAWLGQAVYFALGHYLVTFDPSALAVFFPGLLFGLLRAQTGSVLAGTLLHAMCNILIDVLHRSLV